MQPTFMRLGTKGPLVKVLQTALEALGFPLVQYGIDSKFGTETFGASQDTINTLASITNLAQIVNDPNVTQFNSDGLTKTQYNIIVIIGQNPQMIAQLKPELDAQKVNTHNRERTPDATRSTNGTEKAVYDFFLSKGYTPAGASGVAANIKTESSYSTKAVGDGGKARSLAQWHPDRYQDLTNKGFNLMDFNDSLAAIDYELKNNYPKTYAKIKNATSPEQAAQIMDKEYERSAGTTTGKRMRDAIQIFKTYNA